MKYRWRSILWLLLMVVIILNAAIFFNIPGSRKKPGKDSTSHSRLDRVASHLQVLRKRLNANLNSSSLHRTESSVVEANLEAAEKAFLRKGDSDDGGNDVRSNTIRRHHNVDNYPNEDDEKSTGDVNVDDNSNNINNDDGDEVRKFKIRNPTLGQKSKKSQGHGSRANYSISEVDDLVKIYTMKYKDTNFNLGLLGLGPTSYLELLNKLTSYRTKGTRLGAYIINPRGRRSWEKYHYGIRQHELYDPHGPYLNRLLHDLQTKPIVDVEQKDGGTQIKLIMTFKDDGMALFKPMRFARNQETLPDHFYFADYERHNAEIAAFHLDRILGFNRVPPTIGRLFNVSRDIQEYADIKLANTFFTSPGGNLCFHGQCSYYCDSSHPICGHPIMLEGSLAALLPPLMMATRETWRNPWKRSYSKHIKAYWEVYSDLCVKVQLKSPFNEGRRMLDVLDMSIFDFLTGNLDRHHYETFSEFGNETFLLHLDQGKAFGKAKYDCLSCLAPVRQCCMIRLSTLSKLMKMYQGPDSLSELMRKSTSADPLYPILTEPHLDALDRRLSKILNVIDGCLKEGRVWDDVVINDGVT